MESLLLPIVRIQKQVQVLTSLSLQYKHSPTTPHRHPCTNRGEDPRAPMNGTGVT